MEGGAGCIVQVHTVPKNVVLRELINRIRVILIFNNENEIFVIKSMIAKNSFFTVTFKFKGLLFREIKA